MRLFKNYVICLKIFACRNLQKFYNTLLTKPLFFLSVFVNLRFQELT